MASNEDISDLEAVDFRLGKLLVDCFSDLAPTGPAEWQRFIAREPKSKIFLAKNSDVQAVLRKLTQHEDEPERGGPDLPVVVYYREQGIAPDSNQHPQVIRAVRFDDQETIWDYDKAMRTTTIPITLTYSLLFLAWDRPTIDRMALAWWGHVIPLCRRHSGFSVQYKWNEDIVDVPCSINAPREILTSSE